LRKTSITEQPFRKTIDGGWESFGIVKEVIKHSLIPKVKGKVVEPQPFESNNDVSLF
jgi:hypothetical protein